MIVNDAARCFRAEKVGQSSFIDQFSWPPRSAYICWAEKIGQSGFIDGVDQASWAWIGHLASRGVGSLRELV